MPHPARNSHVRDHLRGALGAAALVAFSIAAFAQTHHSDRHRQPSGQTRSYKAGTLTIEAPWSRATPAGAKVAGGYLRITNAGPVPDRLVGGTAAVAAKFEIHEMTMHGDVMKMRPLDNGIEISPGQTVEFRPGGFHLMFVDLRRPLKEGEVVAGTLVFERAGTVEIEYAVRALGARGGQEHRH
jgi:periplasmic copper chaperone A